MNEILRFLHAPHEGPGYLADYLKRHHVPYRLIRIDQDEPIPPSIDAVSGLVFMGGPMSVNDPLPWIAKLTGLIQRAVAADMPVLGHCLGGQLISKALGGVVTRNPVKEIGWLPVMRAENTIASAWLDRLPQEFEVFHWHGETFSIPAGATRILGSRDCANQAFVIGQTLALQCHIEMTSEMVREWARLGADEMTPVCATIQNPQTMALNLEARVNRLQKIADVFYRRWLEGVK